MVPSARLKLSVKVWVQAGVPDTLIERALGSVNPGELVVLMLIVPDDAGV
jgi:hypothetical protein